MAQFTLKIIALNSSGLAVIAPKMLQMTHRDAHDCRVNTVMSFCEVTSSIFSRASGRGSSDGNVGHVSMLTR